MFITKPIRDNDCLPVAIANALIWQEKPAPLESIMETCNLEEHGTCLLGSGLYIAAYFPYITPLCGTRFRPDLITENTAAIIVDGFARQDGKCNPYVNRYSQLHAWFLYRDTYLTGVCYETYGTTTLDETALDLWPGHIYNFCLINKE